MQRYERSRHDEEVNQSRSPRRCYFPVTTGWGNWYYQPTVSVVQLIKAFQTFPAFAVLVFTSFQIRGRQNAATILAPYFVERSRAIH
jgi:hypothetical protein